MARLKRSLERDVTAPRRAAPPGASAVRAGHERAALSVSVDVVVLTVRDSLLSALLVRRGEPPFRGRHALPGGALRVGDGRKDRGESLDDAAAREVEGATGLDARLVFVEQLGAFGHPDRDPRGRVIGVAYFALVRPDLAARVRPRAAAGHAEWVAVASEPKLAFDHAAIVAAALARLKERVHTTGVLASLVPKTFTIPELRAAWGAVTGEPQDAGNFRRRVGAMVEAGLVEAAPGKRVTSSKPAAVYRFR